MNPGLSLAEREVLDPLEDFEESIEAIEDFDNPGGEPKELQRVSLPIQSRWRLAVLMTDRGLTLKGLADRIEEICGTRPNIQTISNWQTVRDHKPSIHPRFWSILPKALNCTHEELWADYDGHLEEVYVEFPLRTRLRPSKSAQSAQGTASAPSAQKKAKAGSVKAVSEEPETKRAKTARASTQKAESKKPEVKKTEVKKPEVRKLEVNKTKAKKSEVNAADFREFFTPTPPIKSLASVPVLPDI